MHVTVHGIRFFLSSVVLCLFVCLFYGSFVLIYFRGEVGCSILNDFPKKKTGFAIFAL